MSLGKLAAGLAHELNNPASAIVRSAKGFTEHLAGAERASRALGAAGLSPEQLAAVDQVRTICLETPVTSVRSPLERADREDAIVAWLEDHGADVSSAAAAGGNRGDARNARPARGDARRDRRSMRRSRGSPPTARPVASPWRSSGPRPASTISWRP